MAGLAPAIQGRRHGGLLPLDGRLKAAHGEEKL
jgi:hypothetical protein